MAWPLAAPQLVQGDELLAPQVDAPQVGALRKAQNVLRLLELKRETSLQGKVSFEVKSRPLAELLLDLQRQSGVALAAGPEVPAARLLVTARAKEMPLFAAMAALSGLYGLGWSKTADKSYGLKPLGMDEAELQLLRLGNGTGPGMRALWGEDGGDFNQHQAELAQEVVGEVGADALQAKQGVPVSVLTAELQQKLRREFERGASSFLLGFAGQAREGRLLNYELRAGEGALFTLKEVDKAAATGHRLWSSQGNDKGKVWIEVPLTAQPFVVIYAPNRNEVARFPLEVSH